jgi:NAD-dependent deacetylase sirtuin 2
MSLHESAYNLIEESNRILVITGAGISVSAGIPDFRTPGVGLYDTIGKHIGLTKPEDVFNIHFFREEPSLFYTVAKTLFRDDYVPTKTHEFIKMIQDKGKLLRNYTQNIDGLERKVGIKDELLVEAHGSFNAAECTNPECNSEQDVLLLKKNINIDRVTKCENCGSFVKPTIVFFGEGLPQRYLKLIDDDIKNCDLLIIIGTSLKVNPIASIPSRIADRGVPKIVINRDFCIKRNKGDIALYGGYCDEETSKIMDIER